MSTSTQNESEEKERVSYTRFGLSDGGRRLLWERGRRRVAGRRCRRRRHSHRGGLRAVVVRVVGGGDRVRGRVAGLGHGGGGGGRPRRLGLGGGIYRLERGGGAGVGEKRGVL
jgi:hypothetical protein